MFYIENGEVKNFSIDFKVLKRFVRESICTALCFGHEYKKVGNQHTKYLKCIKCGKVVKEE
jgi:hypothetical protein